jgi:ABC-2 type transport system permease protein
VTIPCGLVVCYSCRFLFSSATVIFVRAENLQYLWYHMYRLGLRPDSIYPAWLKYAVLTVLPMGLIASVPARLLLGIASPWLALWAVFVAGISLWGSNRLWEFALRSYSSASS